MKKALITGANGQDASYLAELLIEKDYEVFGTIRRNSVPESQTTRIEELHQSKKINLEYMDLLDTFSVENLIKEIQPDEIYHLAAQSHVKISFEMPEYTIKTNVNGTLAILESIRRYSPHSKLYNAATSEMFGNSIDSDGYQRETTPMYPVSPYGCSKLCAYSLCNNYKNAYGIFASSGILFNHESPRRGINFVSNKVVSSAVKIKKRKLDKLTLGNLSAQRDWGHAKDYVKAMWLMLQSEKPDNYVVATGETRSVKQLVDIVFAKLNLNPDDYVETNEKYQRAEELHALRGCNKKIKKELGWELSYSFEEMINEMIEYWNKTINN